MAAPSGRKEGRRRGLFGQHRQAGRDASRRHRNRSQYFFGRTAKLVAGAGAIIHAQKAMFQIGNFLIVVAVTLALIMVAVRVYHDMVIADDWRWKTHLAFCSSSLFCWSRRSRSQCQRYFPSPWHWARLRSGKDGLPTILGNVDGSPSSQPAVPGRKRRNCAKGEDNGLDDVFGANAS